MAISGEALRRTLQAGIKSPSIRWGLVENASQMERYDQAARYALVVSISAPGVNVDLYTEVANLIAAEVEVET